jgi:hypothetical protein
LDGDSCSSISDIVDDIQIDSVFSSVCGRLFEFKIGISMSFDSFVTIDIDGHVTTGISGILTSGVVSVEELTLSILLSGTGKVVDLIGSSLIEDIEAECGGDGDTGVTGNGDTSRGIGFLIGSDIGGRVGDGV